MADHILERSRAFDIKIDGNPFPFHDPIVTGAQILQKAGLFPTDDHLLFQELNDGQLEEIRPDESVDLRNGGREQFITFFVLGLLAILLFMPTGILGRPEVEKV